MTDRQTRIEKDRRLNRPSPRRNTPDQAAVTSTKYTGSGKSAPNLVQEDTKEGQIAKNQAVTSTKYTGSGLRITCPAANALRLLTSRGCPSQCQYAKDTAGKLLVASVRNAQQLISCCKLVVPNFLSRQRDVQGRSRKSVRQTMADSGS